MPNSRQAQRSPELSRNATVSSEYLRLFASAAATRGLEVGPIFSASGIDRSILARRGARVGGVATIRQYLSAGLIDELHLAIAPVVLGSGEHLFSGIHAPSLRYRCTEHVPTSLATHVVLTRV